MLFSIIVPGVEVNELSTAVCGRSESSSHRLIPTYSIELGLNRCLPTRNVSPDWHSRLFFAQFPFSSILVIHFIHSFPLANDRLVDFFGDCRDGRIRLFRVSIVDGNFKPCHFYRGFTSAKKKLEPLDKSDLKPSTNKDLK